MKTKVTYEVRPGLTLELEAENQKDVVREIARYAEILGEPCCGLCGQTNLVPGHRVVQKYQFYEMRCVDCHARLSFGQLQEGDALYPIRRLTAEGKPDHEHGQEGEHCGWTHYRGEGNAPPPPRRSANPQQSPQATPGATPAASSAPKPPNGTPPPAKPAGAEQGDVDAITENQWTLICAELGKHLISPEAFLRRYGKSCWQQIAAGQFEKAMAAAKQPDDELRAVQKAMPTRISDTQWNTILAALERSKISVEPFLRWAGYTSPTLIRPEEFDRFLRAAQNPPPDLRRPATAPMGARR